MKNQNPLGMRIKQLINKKNLSVAKFEKTAELKPSAVRDIIIGKSKNPTINTLSKICKTLACSLNDLFDNERAIQEVPLLDKYGNIEWDCPLFVECAETIEKYLSKYKLNFKLNKVLNLTIELYLQSLIKNDKQIDEKSAEWSVEKLQTSDQLHLLHR